MDLRPWGAARGVPSLAMPTWRRGGVAAAPSNHDLNEVPRQELNLRTRVGVARDADLEAGRLCRRAVYSPLTEMPPPRIELGHAV